MLILPPALGSKSGSKEPENRQKLSSRTVSEWWTWEVSRKERGVSLVSFLKARCPEAPSLKALKRAIDTKCCSVNAQLETLSTRTLQMGDVVALRKAAFVSRVVSCKVLFEDDFLLVCNKPAGVVSEKKELKAQITGFQGHWELVHRLDKETTGVLIIAKSSAVKQKMIPLFKKQEVRKIYLAVVDGVLKKEEGVVDNRLGKVGQKGGQPVYGVDTQGLRAVTQWKCLERGNKASLVWCEPKTGRTHQLRAHLSGLHHPILGDTQYGDKFICPVLPERYLLHAYQVHFIHPMTCQPLKITAPIPRDFKQCWDQLKRKK